MSLDREIDDLLAVDHSPEFVARVRQRITAEPPPRAAWFWPRLLPVAAGVVVVAIALVMLSPWSAAVAPTTEVAIAPTSASPIAPRSEAPLARTGVTVAPTSEEPIAPTSVTVAPTSVAVAPTTKVAIAPTSASPIAPRSEAPLAPTSDTVAPTSASPLTPEVVLSANETRALGLLLTRLRDGELPDMADAIKASDATGPPWIEIAPVVIEPIAQLAQSEGEHQ